MRTSLMAAIGFAATAMACHAAYADTVLFNTGKPGPDGSYYQFSSAESVAATFVVDADSVMTAVQGYFYARRQSVDLDNTVAIYAGANGPAGAPLYQASFVTRGGKPAWKGVRGVWWPLARGTYSVALSTTAPPNAEFMITNAPDPLPQYWYGTADGWFPSHSNVGMRASIAGKD